MLVLCAVVLLHTVLSIHAGLSSLMYLCSERNSLFLNMRMIRYFHPLELKVISGVRFSLRVGKLQMPIFTLAYLHAQYVLCLRIVCFLEPLGLLADQYSAGFLASTASERTDLRSRLTENTVRIDIPPEQGIHEPEGRMTVFSILADPVERVVKVISSTFVDNLCGAFTKCR